MVLFTASAQHAAVNFPQAAIMEFAPAVTGALWQAPPLERQGLTRQDWLAAMPPSNLALKQLEVLYLLGSLHYRPLGTYLSRTFPYPAWFTDPKVTASEGPLVRFQAALVQVEERIVGRNAQRRVAYPFFAAECGADQYQYLRGPRAFNPFHRNRLKRPERTLGRCKKYSFN